MGAEFCIESKDIRYIASISYGKDSLAQLEVIFQNGLPLTDIVTASAGS